MLFLTSTSIFPHERPMKSICGRGGNMVMLSFLWPSIIYWWLSYTLHLYNCAKNVWEFCAKVEKVKKAEGFCSGKTKHLKIFRCRIRMHKPDAASQRCCRPRGWWWACCRQKCWHWPWRAGLKIWWMPSFWRIDTACNSGSVSEYKATLISG